MSSFASSAPLWRSRISRARPLLLALGLLLVTALLLAPLSASSGQERPTMSFELESSDPAAALLQVRSMLESSGGRVSQVELSEGVRGVRARLEAAVPESSTTGVFSRTLSSFQVTSASTTARGSVERVLLREERNAAELRLAEARSAIADAAPQASAAQMARLLEALAAAEATLQEVSVDMSTADSGGSVTRVSFLIRTPRRFSTGTLTLALTLVASAASALLVSRLPRRSGRLAPPARV